ncbi:hypothetical protein [Belnapia rosea]|uniref:Uncharacterized protein n=1 Tax=Belnapia rosea TaxID=938405 RepID=A0A1G7DRD6_9PROT|nr:hypothetical protein [Belnapia rosea]SDB74769.1 hypothetical protein SAMN02927895_05471 [Belnapia rosea]SDE54104.1 hypothetical protein SAMN04487779_10518 [Belnapia rosea]
MVARLMALLSVALLVGPSITARAAPPPTCRLQSVVDVIAQHLPLDRRYTRIDPWSIVEVPSADPRLVRCSLCVMVLHYDMPHLGEVPALRCEAWTFAVRAVRNGYVVDVAR